jgi:hypothetical protein
MYHSIITHTANLQTETDWLTTEQNNSRLISKLFSILHQKVTFFFPPFANPFPVYLLATFEDDGVTSRYLLCKEKKD